MLARPKFIDPDSLDDDTTEVAARASTTPIAAVLTVEEFARIFRLDPKTVREEIDAGRLKASRFGRKRVIRISRREVSSRLQGRVLLGGESDADKTR